MLLLLLRAACALPPAGAWRGSAVQAGAYGGAVLEDEIRRPSLAQYAAGAGCARFPCCVHDRRVLVVGNGWGVWQGRGLCCWRSMR